MNDLGVPNSAPAQSYQRAVERLKALSSLDDESILPLARTTALLHGEQTPWAAVLFHGLTSHPGQYQAFAPLVHRSGWNVLVPRFPEHGDRNPMTARLKSLTAERMISTGAEALDIAQGLGESVAVLGISAGATLAAFFAQRRLDLARAVAVSPLFSVLQLSFDVNRLAERAALRLPNAFVWWNRADPGMPPRTTAYPRFSTRALAQCMRIGDDVYAASARAAPQCASVIVAINRRDPSVNNAVSMEVLRRWQARAADRVRLTELNDLPRTHDIITPETPDARTDLVYPVLLDLLTKA